MRRILFILVLNLSLYSMDDSFLMEKEDGLLDRETRELLLMQETIEQSLKVFNFEMPYLEVGNPERLPDQINHWETLPLEVKSYIFSFMPEQIHNLLLVNWECHNLSKELNFLKLVALIMVKKNLEKAVNTYALAVENDDKFLVEAIVSADLYERVIRESCLEMFTKEFSSLDRNIAPLLINELKDTKKAFIKAIVKLYQQAARKLFIKAAEQGDHKLISLFFNNGIDIDINHECNAGGNNALIEAAFKGYNEVVELLISNGADVNAKNSLGETALMFCVATKKKEVVEFLLNHGANINEESTKGTTVFKIAASYGHREIRRLLLERTNVSQDPLCSKYDFAKEGSDITAQFDAEDQIEILVTNDTSVNPFNIDLGSYEEVKQFLIPKEYGIFKSYINDRYGIQDYKEKIAKRFLGSENYAPLSPLRLYINDIYDIQDHKTDIFRYLFEQYSKRQSWFHLCKKHISPYGEEQVQSTNTFLNFVNADQDEYTIDALPDLEASQTNFQQIIEPNDAEHENYKYPTRYISTLNSIIEMTKIDHVLKIMKDSNSSGQDSEQNE